MPALPLLSRSSNKAAALIIVLAFVVLLAGLALAYLSRTTSDRQLAQSSYNDTSADLLARSALDIVVGDFQKEIVNGSISPAPTVSASPVATIAFIPSAAANVVPQRNVSGSGANTVPNLIRISLRGDPTASPAIGSRASAVNSTNDLSANGRSISTTRWNKHCLIPLVSTATFDNPIPISPSPGPTANPGQTPATWYPPDWVIVTRAGPTPCASWPPDGRLADASASNTNYTIGRYAYAVYDEGGLLEMNVAGYPAPPTPLPAYLTDIGRKGSVAWADIRALVTPTPTGTPINTKIAGFRNYATTGQNNVSNFNFSYTNNSQVQSFVDYFLGSQIVSGSFVGSSARVGTSRDFIAVNSVTVADGRTDQSFTTRAQLINYFKSANISVNLLQYLGTFSREQNKPTLPLTTAWPFTRVALPQRFYLGNLNLVVYPTPTPAPTVTPTPTATPTLTPTIQTALGLLFASAKTPPPGTPTPTPGPCDSQVRWKYVGNQDPNNTTPLLAIPAFPSDLTTLDFFQYINYALFGVTTADSTDIPYTLGIGAALIDMYDTETTMLTGIYYGSHAASCPDGIGACLVYGAEVTSSTARSQAPTCISAPPSPDPHTSSDGPPSINLGFRNAGEFGWAYSILNAANGRNSSSAPKYLIDFKDAYNSATNPDPALLDFFTFNSASVRAGIVSLNTRQVPVLAAILAQAVYGGTGFVLSTTQATNAANSIVNDATNGTIVKPAMSRADIARFPSLVSSAPFNGTPSQDRKDTFARVFSETTQTRTWGLLIDLVAQTGHYKPNATGLADFVVEGEKRYWLHIAIDRFDGSIVGQQLEEVVE